MQGQEVIPLGRYDEISYTIGGHFLVRSGGDRDPDTWEWANAHWAIVDSQGRVVVAPGRYDEITAASDSRFIVRIGGNFNPTTWQMENARWAVLDAQGNEVIPFGRYDRIHLLGHFSFLYHDAGMVYDFKVTAGDRIGVRCLGGHEVIPMGRYDWVQSIHNGLAIVVRDGRVGVVNLEAMD